MLGVLAGDLHASAQTAGLVPTLNQLGYALGILLLRAAGRSLRPPPGDPGQVRPAGAGAGLGGLAPGMTTLLCASLAIGLTATVAQDFVPAAATLARIEHRGRIVGTVMTGLLLGILLSRVGSGLIAGHLGLARGLPHRRRGHGPGRAGLGAMGAALRADHHGGLWRAAGQPGTAVARASGAAPRHLGAGDPGGRLQRVLVDAGGDAAGRALPPGQRGGRRVRPGRCGRAR